MNRIPEEYIDYLWQYQLFDTTRLVTTEGDAIEVVSKGIPNNDAGPDFSNARVRIGDTEWAGSVEIHYKASDWYAHRHEEDPAYENVILHVVIHNDRPVINRGGVQISTLTLGPYLDQDHFKNYQRFIAAKSWVACEAAAKRVDIFKWTKHKERLAFERLEQKVSGILEVLDMMNGDWEKVVLLLLARSFGAKVNALPFEDLIQRTPFSVIKKHANDPFQLEALLLGQAGFLAGDELLPDGYTVRLLSEYSFLKNKYDLKPMRKVSWKNARIRPSSAPQIRIVQFAHLCHSINSLTSLMLNANSQELNQLFAIRLEGYWSEHIGLGRSAAKRKRAVGQSLIDRIIINVVGPVRFAYGRFSDTQSFRESALSLLEATTPEDNQIIRKWKTIGVDSGNALESQALLQLKRHHCDQKKCLSCSIGQELLRKDESKIRRHTDLT